MTVQLSPLWRQAIEDFQESGFTYGDLVPHTWFYEHFGIDPKSTKDADERDRLQLEFATALGRFKEKMLCEHLMNFESVARQGYLIVRPEAQTESALKDTRHDLRKIISQGMRRVVHVNKEALSDAQLAENSDAIAKFATLQAMSAPKQWLRPLSLSSRRS